MRCANLHERGYELNSREPLMTRLSGYSFGGSCGVTGTAADRRGRCSRWRRRRRVSAPRKSRFAGDPSSWECLRRESGQKAPRAVGAAGTEGMLPREEGAFAPREAGMLPCASAEQAQPNIAGWSSLVARRAHNPKVTGSNPVPATKRIAGPSREAPDLFAATTSYARRRTAQSRTRACARSAVTSSHCSIVASAGKSAS